MLHSDTICDVIVWFSIKVRFYTVVLVTAYKQGNVASSVARYDPPAIDFLLVVRVQSIKCAVIIFARRGGTRLEYRGFSFTSRSSICSVERVLLACS
jgi:hypothetical protein